MSKHAPTHRQGPHTYQPWTAAATFARLVQGANPWLAIGEFLDDWRFASPEQRLSLIATPLPVPVAPEHHRWAAFFAAMVEELCQQAGIPVPTWTERTEYVLEEPWYLHKGHRPEWRAWQEETSPEPFRRRKIYGGDNILARA